jgi:hypothetical protein
VRTEFFRPPPDPWPEQVEPVDPPPWTGRPKGPPPGAAISELLLARSARAAIHLDYIDAFPGGFELQIRAETDIAYHDLCREGDRFGPDVFGAHWPTAGERSDVLPPALLRVGVQFADGRSATSIGGHDRPVGGPVVWCLRGGGRGGAGGSSFNQGYWISPLPPPGPVAILCEWPVVEIPLTRREVDARTILDAAERARPMFADEHHVVRDGRRWRVGSAAEVAWINDGISAGATIAAAIPPTFAAHCTLGLPASRDRAESTAHERAVLELLGRLTPQQPWWLGYLDTGASDVVFPYAPRTTVYSGYRYVLVEAGPAQAAGWREQGFNWALPDLMFPADRSWLLSSMWDDPWTSVGGPRELVDALLSDPTLGPRAARMGSDQQLDRPSPTDDCSCREAHLD